MIEIQIVVLSLQMSYHWWTDGHVLFFEKH